MEGFFSSAGTVFLRGYGDNGADVVREDDLES